MISRLNSIKTTGILLTKEIKFGVVVLTSSLMICSSCQSGEPPISKKLDDPQIIEILVDISIARAAVAPLPFDVADSIRMGYYDQIAIIHQLETNEIDKLLEQLSNDPDRFQHLLGSAGDTIRARNERREDHR